MSKSPFPPSKRFFRVKDIADLLDRDPKTIRRWITSEKLRATKLGRDWQINCEDLRKFFLENQNMEIADVL